MFSSGIDEFNLDDIVSSRDNDGSSGNESDLSDEVNDLLDELVSLMEPADPPEDISNFEAQNHVSEYIPSYSSNLEYHESTTSPTQEVADSYCVNKSQPSTFHYHDVGDCANPNTPASRINMNVAHSSIPQIGNTSGYGQMDIISDRHPSASNCEQYLTYQLPETITEHHSLGHSYDYSPIELYHYENVTDETHFENAKVACADYRHRRKSL